MSKTKKTKTAEERYPTLDAKFKKVDSMSARGVLMTVAHQYSLIAKELVGTIEVKAAKLYAQSSKLLRDAAKAFPDKKDAEMSDTQKARLYWLTAAVEEEFWHDCLIPRFTKDAKADKASRKALPIVKHVHKLLFTPYSK